MLISVFIVDKYACGENIETWKDSDGECICIEADPFTLCQQCLCMKGFADLMLLLDVIGKEK
jgi:hypothetical protein